MSQRYRLCEVLVLTLALTFSFGVRAEEGELSGDEIDEIFDDVNHEETQTAAVAPTPRDDFNDSMPSSDSDKRENVDDEEDAAAEINNTVGDSLTESNSFQSYTPEPEVTADQFIRGGGGNSFSGSSDPGSYNYEPPKKKKKAKVAKSKAKSKKKAISKKSSKGKKVAKSSKSSKSKSRKVASSKKSKRFR